MDYLIVTDESHRLQMTFIAANDIRNNVFLSYAVKRGSFFLNPNFGSRLHTIKSTSKADIALARSYGVECTTWLIDIGRVKAIEIISEKIDSGIVLNTNVTLINDKIIPYTYYHRIF